jgi:hypothetical protein
LARGQADNRFGGFPSSILDVGPGQVLTQYRRAQADEVDEEEEGEEAEDAGRTGTTRGRSAAAAAAAAAAATNNLEEDEGISLENSLPGESRPKPNGGSNAYTKTWDFKSLESLTSPQRPGSEVDTAAATADTEDAEADVDAADVDGASNVAQLSSGDEDDARLHEVAVEESDDLRPILEDGGSNADGVPNAELPAPEYSEYESPPLRPPPPAFGDEDQMDKVPGGMWYDEQEVLTVPAEATLGQDQASDKVTEIRVGDEAEDAVSLPSHDSTKEELRM